MDKDGSADFVLNQAGKISIVYGGKSGNGFSYLSQDTTRCDDNRSNRQKKFNSLVDHLGTQLHTGASVDSSLIRWK